LGISGTGPLVGPPASKRSRIPCGLGLGEADVWLDVALLGEMLLGEGLLGGALLGEALLVP
jgi:hypothetical protein